MAYEIGGRADKNGNRYEFNWVIYNILDVIQERISYVTIEAIGEDEVGVDLWIGRKDGTKEGQQCKGRNASANEWDFSTANAKHIFTNWKKQLYRGQEYHVSLVSPLTFQLFEDLISRARNSRENDPESFYKYQILGSGSETRRLFKSYCKVMELDVQNPGDLLKCIDYLKRTNIHQWGDSISKDMVLRQIYTLFGGNEETNYGLFLDLVLTEDIKGKELNAAFLLNYCKEKKIVFRNLAYDDRIAPAIENLNLEYRNTFCCLESGLIQRKEYERCLEAVYDGYSVILHGRAGTGKTGCTENLINQLESKNIPYLAIKLDKRVPHGTTENWGREMGLPASPVLCLDSISSGNLAVLILDQLDALRWTQSHSGEALDICLQLIHEVETINQGRDEKICIVMVCRTYDLENDRNIQKLFKDEKRIDTLVWKKIFVDKFEEDIIKQLVGTIYQQLHRKTRELLSIPSNLYIWEQLGENEYKKTIYTTNQLVSEWWSQLEEKARRNFLDINTLNQIRNKIVDFCESKGRLYAPSVKVSMARGYSEFLQSNGFLKISNGKVSFFHQSILDCFLAEKMFNKFYDEESIENIIGVKELQVPARRYQMQMFLQQLIEIDEDDFVEASKGILESKNIRFNMKYVVLELCSQIEEIGDSIAKFVKSYLEVDEWKNYFLNTVIRGKKQYIHLLRDEGILDFWAEADFREVVINLYCSISPDYDDKDERFIEKYALKGEGDKNWQGVFWNDINEGSDYFFEIRLKFFRKFPDILDSYLDITSMMKKCELRTIRMIALMLEYDSIKQNRFLYQQEEVVFDKIDIFIRYYEEAIQYLLPFIPLDDKSSLDMNWSFRYSYSRGLQRACIEIIKKAGRIYAAQKPEEYIRIMQRYMGTGIELHNEIILDTFFYLPNSYADWVIDYVSTDFSKTMFESTSGNKHKLMLSKKLVEKNSCICSENKYQKLESRVIQFVDIYVKDNLKERIEYNREQKGEHAYWRFWGFFQMELLTILPEERMSREAKNLLMVLQRAIGDYSRYSYKSFEAQKVYSPVSDKEISISGWKKIIFSEKLLHRKEAHTQYINGRLINNSLSEFIMSFSCAVRKEPSAFLDFMLDTKILPPEPYIDSFFNMISLNEIVLSVKHSKLEALIYKYGYDYESRRAFNICCIVSRRSDEVWSDGVVKFICDIAQNHQDPEGELLTLHNADAKKLSYCEEIESEVLNSSRSQAVLTIAQLLWSQTVQLEQVRETIEVASEEKNQAVVCSCLEVLTAAYHIDKVWSVSLFFKILNQNYRLMYYRNCKELFFLTYHDYRDTIIEIVEKGFYSNDNKLVKASGYIVAEMYMIHDIFTEILYYPENMTKEQVDSILEMLIVYFDIEKYNEKAKEALLRFIKCDTHKDNKFVWTRLFNDERINLKRDFNFLMTLMTSKINERLIYSFVYYLEKGHKLIDYADIIINMSKNLLDSKLNFEGNAWRIERNLSKLTIALYDETSSGNTEKDKSISMACLDIWDLMFEKQIGNTRILMEKMMEI